MTPGLRRGIAVADRQHHIGERRAAEVACGGAVAGSREGQHGYGKVYRSARKALSNRRRGMALRSGHQRLTPEHLAKVLLEDKEGLCANLIKAAGGDPKIVLAQIEAELNKLPKVEGSGAGQVYLSPELARVFDQAEKIAEKAGDSYVTVERLLLALAMAKDTPSGKALAAGGVTPQSLNAAIEQLRKGRKAESASAEEGYDALKKYARDLTEAAREGKLDPVIGRDEEIRRTIQVLSRRTKNNPVLIGEPGVGKTAIVEGLGAAHRQRRRAGEPEGQAPDGARSRRDGRRREIPRRVRGAAEGRLAGDHRRGRARSSSSSTNCTRWSAPARRKARWTPRTC